MSLYRQKLSKVKCSKCALLIPLKRWREHTLQHTALKLLELDNYPQSFLSLTKHYCSKLEKIEGQENEVASRSQLIAAYDTLKMLYFKDFRNDEDDRPLSPVNSPSFEKMTEALAPQNFNYSSCYNEEGSEPPAPYSYSVSIQQLNQTVFHCEQLIKELKQAFFTADPVTPTLGEERLLWGTGVFEGLKGHTAAKYVAENYWDCVKELLAVNPNPSPYDIRHALKKSLHTMDVNLKQGYSELGQSRWSGVTGCVCLLQTVPQADPDFGGDSRASTKLSQFTDVQGNYGMVHIANIGSVSAVISRAGKAKRISYNHVVGDSNERQRVLENGATISSHGEVNCVTPVTRALGFHGDPTLRQCISQKPYCNSIPLFHDDEYILIGNSTFYKYIGAQEACNMCRALLIPSVRKLVHVFSNLPDQVQDEAISQTSTLDYDALVSDCEGVSQDSSMIPDNESEDNAGEDINWDDMFDDPIENLDEDSVCRMLSEAMTNALVEGAREAGAVGPLICTVVLLPGSLRAARRRLLYEQAIYELKKRYNNYALSEISLASFTEQQCTISVSQGTPSVPPSSALLSDYNETTSTPVEHPLSRNLSSKSDAEDNRVYEVQIAEHLTIEPGELVFQDKGVLKFGRPLDPAKYTNINVESLKLEDFGDHMSKQEKRDMIRDMVSCVIQENEEEEEGEEGLGLLLNKTPLTTVS